MEAIEHGADDKDDDLCLQCNSRRQVESEAFRSATRKVAALSAVCCVLCVLTIIASCCSLYIYYRFQGFRQDLVAMVEMNYDEADDILAEHFKTDHNSMPMYGFPEDDREYEDFVTEKTNRIRRQRKKGNKNSDVPKPEKQSGKKLKCRKKQQKTCECCKKSLSGYIVKLIRKEFAKKKENEVTTAKPQTSAPQSENLDKTNKNAFVSTAHYTTYVDKEFIDKKFDFTEHDFDRHPPNNENGELESESNDEMHVEVPEWQAAPLTLKFFKEADWMVNSTTDKIFDYSKTTGKFIAKFTGLYHLYAHVLFYDVNTSMAIGLIHERKKGLPRGSRVVFQCMKSEDYVEKKLTVRHNSNYKSCSVNGVLYLNKGDNVAMQSLYTDTCFDLTRGATYFGGIFFETSNTRKPK